MQMMLCSAAFYMAETSESVSRSLLSALCCTFSFVHFWDARTCRNRVSSVIETVSVFATNSDVSLLCRHIDTLNAFSAMVSQPQCQMQYVDQCDTASQVNNVQENQLSLSTSMAKSVSTLTLSRRLFCSPLAQQQVCCAAELPP